MDINIFRDICAYIGGAGTLILPLIFSRKLEILKARNEKVNYITKTQFDAEFKIYQELSETSFNMLLQVSQLFPAGIDSLPEDKEQRQIIFIERHKKANEELVNFQNKLYQVAPFISEKMYNLFEELRTEARLQIIFYPDFIISPNSEHLKELRKEITACWKRTPELHSLHEKIIKSLREYLSSLKVLD